MNQENIGLFMYVTRHIPIESQDLMDGIFHCQEDISPMGLFLMDFQTVCYCSSSWHGSVTTKFSYPKCRRPVAQAHKSSYLSHWRDHEGKGFSLHDAIHHERE